ncbi:hypothetical protein IEO21_07447 [Rhodonia placenta]|uniref:F-box domain-containing protein n=1 Tax=Rhodonia placenta TaxID=104341 RepID=A0A8H7NYI0_9APHY|nr:hypothetical protein IEO21_07447 [Postia placenta]
MEDSETSSLKEDQMRLRRKDVNMPYLLNIRNRSLPVELWMHILDDVVGERNYDVIARCARVCRFFRNMCQMHLMGVFTFGSDEDVERLKTDMAAKEIGGWPGPDVVYIRSGKDSKSIPHVATFASRFAGRWTRIEQLRFAETSWPSSLRAADAAVFRNLSRFASITKLDLCEVTFPSIVTFGALVSALSGLKELYLLDVNFTGSSVLSDPRTLSDFRLLPPTDNLRNIIVGYVSEDGHHGFHPSAWQCYIELLDFMTAVSNPCGKSPRVYPWGAVRNLRLDENVWWKFSSSSIARLLHALPSLENLNFATADSNVADLEITGVPAQPRLEPIAIGVYDRQCDFFENTNPTSLRIHGCDASCVGVREILSHVTLRCVSSVNIRFKPLARSDRRELSEGLSQLDTVLLPSVFHNLVHVLISVRFARSRCQVEMKEMTEWAHLVKSCLARLHEWGILGNSWRRYDSMTDKNGNVRIVKVHASKGRAPSAAMAAYTAWKRSSWTKGSRQPTSGSERQAAPQQWVTEVTARGRAYEVEARGVKGV